MYWKLRSKRKQTNTTVKKLNDLLKLKTDAAYFKKETGKTKISVEEALILAKYFNTTVEELFSA